MCIIHLHRYVFKIAALLKLSNDHVIQSRVGHYSNKYLFEQELRIKRSYLRIKID